MKSRSREGTSPEHVQRGTDPVTEAGTLRLNHVLNQELGYPDTLPHHNPTLTTLPHHNPTSTTTPWCLLWTPLC